MEHSVPEGRGVDTRVHAVSVSHSLRLVEHGTRLHYCPAQDHPPPNSDTFKLPALSLVPIFYISLLIFRCFHQPLTATLFYNLKPGTISKSMHMMYNCLNYNWFKVDLLQAFLLEGGWAESVLVRFKGTEQYLEV
jgi:hypothetical protein